MSELHTEETLVDVPTIDELALWDNQIDKVYTERNKLVSLVMDMCLELGLEAGTARDPDYPADDEWGNLVFFQLPTGQCAFHIHQSEMHYFARFPHWPYPWDGHTTTEKFERILNPRLDLLHMRSWSISSRGGLLASTFATKALTGVWVEQELHHLDKVLFASEDTEMEVVIDEE